MSVTKKYLLVVLATLLLIPTKEIAFGRCTFDLGWSCLAHRDIQTAIQKTKRPHTRSAKLGDRAWQIVYVRCTKYNKPRLKQMRAAPRCLDNWGGRRWFTKLHECGMSGMDQCPTGDVLQRCSEHNLSVSDPTKRWDQIMHYILILAGNLSLRFVWTNEIKCFTTVIVYR